MPTIIQQIRAKCIQTIENKAWYYQYNSVWNEVLSPNAKELRIWRGPSPLSLHRIGRMFSLAHSMKHILYCSPLFIKTNCISIQSDKPHSNKDHIVWHRPVILKEAVLHTDARVQRSIHGIWVERYQLERIKAFSKKLDMWNKGRQVKRHLYIGVGEYTTIAQWPLHSGRTQREATKNGDLLLALWRQCLESNLRMGDYTYAISNTTLVWTKNVDYIEGFA